jgi:hypothetical protein
LFYDFHYFGEAPFERGEDPELEVVDAHLAVYEVNDFYRECDGGQFNHEQANPVGGKNRNDYGNDNDDYKDGVDELGAKFWDAADFADNGPDSLFFLLELFEFMLEVFEFFFEFVVFHGQLLAKKFSGFGVCLGIRIPAGCAFCKEQCGS